MAVGLKTKRAVTLACIGGARLPCRSSPTGPSLYLVPPFPRSGWSRTEVRNGEIR